MERLENFIGETVKESRMPGLSCAAVVGDRLVWSAGFGWADVENAVPMTADTVLTVCSICKTVTATAGILLWQEGALDLDADVNEYLEFSVRNPHHPEVPVTVRQLLTHRSSVLDGPAFPSSYVAGPNPAQSAQWLRSYLVPGGSLYDPEANFHTWAPGTISPPDTPRPYCNVGYGLLSLVIEVIAGEPFEGFCRRALFEPLGMDSSWWNLQDVRAGRHAIPYTLIPGSRDELEQLEFFVAGEREAARGARPGSLFRHAIYSPPFASAGHLRSSARDMGNFLALYTGGGATCGKVFLTDATMRHVFSDESFGRAICWQKARSGAGRTMWFHSGGDPGFGSLMTFDPDSSVGVVILSNYQGPVPFLQDVHRRIVQEFRGA